MTKTQLNETIEYLARRAKQSPALDALQLSQAAQAQAQVAAAMPPTPTELVIEAGVLLSRAGLQWFLTR